MKLVLLKLADRANDDGECWPGMDAVAASCGVSKASMIRYLAKMEEDGILRIDRRKGDNGRQQTNVYVLNMDYQPGVKLQPGMDEPGCKSDDNRVALVKPEIRLKPYLETTIETTDATSKLAAPAGIVPEPVQYLDGRWVVDDAVFDSWITAYQNGRTFVDTEDWIEAELAKASVWLMANPRKRKKNYLRFITGWLTRASQPQQRSTAKPQQRAYH